MCAGLAFAVAVCSGLSREILAAAVQAGAAHRVATVGHCPDSLSFEGAAAAGMTCFEHLTGSWRGHLAPGVALPPSAGNMETEVLRLVAAELDWDAVRRLADCLAARGLWNCPTLVATAVIAEPQAAMEADPTFTRLRNYVRPTALDVWACVDPSTRRDGQWLEAVRARNAVFARIVRALHERRAPLLAGTDAPVRFVVPGFSLHDELAWLVDAGSRRRMRPSRERRLPGRATWGLRVAHRGGAGLRGGRCPRHLPAGRGAAPLQPPSAHAGPAAGPSRAVHWGRLRASDGRCRTAVRRCLRVRGRGPGRYFRQRQPRHDPRVHLAYRRRLPHCHRTYPADATSDMPNRCWPSRPTESMAPS
jgi:hypothetical protein